MSDDDAGYPGAPPDWYPDPAGGPGKRWWDGYAWTEGVVLPSQPPPPEANPTATPMPGYGAYGGTAVPNQWQVAPSVGALFESKLWVTPVARFAVGFFGIYYLWQYIYARTERALLRSLGHQYHEIIVATQHNRTPPPLNLTSHANGALVAINSLMILAALAAVVFACIWQYRAASTARALGYPAKHSAGWGVGSWFVPVVALWMPYQAIRDCLPPGDPNRVIVKRFWFLFIVEQLLATANVITLLTTSGPASVFISAIGVICCLGIVVTGTGYVRAIATDHRAAVGR